MKINIVEQKQFDLNQILINNISINNHDYTISIEDKTRQHPNDLWIEFNGHEFMIKVSNDGKVTFYRNRYESIETGPSKVKRIDVIHEALYENEKTYIPFWDKEGVFSDDRKFSVEFGAGHSCVERSESEG